MLKKLTAAFLVRSPFGHVPVWSGPCLAMSIFGRASISDDLLLAILLILLLLLYITILLMRAVSMDSIGEPMRPFFASSLEFMVSLV